jgi:hypothetical protein
MSPRIYVPASGAEAWKPLLASPERHWRAGFSAYAMAHCWHAAEELDGLPGEIRELLEQSPELAALEPLLVIPEHKVALPGGRAASQNDVWLLARAARGLVSIAVEGKVSESPGETLGEWRKAMSDGKKERLGFLQDLLGLQGDLDDSVRYQFLHRAASALIEAERFHASYAAVIVHSFSQDDAWFPDFQRFAQLFGQDVGMGKLGAIDVPKGRKLFMGWAKGDATYLEDRSDQAPSTAPPSIPPL